MPQALAQAHMGQHVGGALARIALAQAPGQHHVFQRGEVAHELKALEHKAHFLRPQCGAGVLVQRKQVLPVQAHRAARGVSSPAMMDSSVLLPDPEAPTMATVSLGARRKSMSRRMSSVPAESRPT